MNNTPSVPFEVRIADAEARHAEALAKAKIKPKPDEGRDGRQLTH